MHSLIPESLMTPTSVESPLTHHLLYCDFFYESLLLLSSMTLFLTLTHVALYRATFMFRAPTVYERPWTSLSLTSSVKSLFTTTIITFTLTLNSDTP